LVEISHRERVVRAKIVYYGPAAGGKTTNLVVLHRRADPKRRGEMVSVNSTQDRTILLDLLPVKTPAFRGYELRFQVIGVPGQRMYAASRQLLLNGADSVVFVANSAADRWEETIQSLREMNKNLVAHGLDPTTIPVVFQYNKRDLPEVTPADAMEKTLNARHSPSFPAVAIREEGVLETFAAALQQTMQDITTRYKLGASVRNARSIEEWTAESMRTLFGAVSSTDLSQSEPFSAHASRRASAGGSVSASPSTSTNVTIPAAAARSSSTDPTRERVAVKVPVARSLEGTHSPSAATPATDPQAAESLVDSYAQAAADLTTALEDMRDQRDSVEQRLLETGAPLEAARALLGGASAEDVLKALLMGMADTLGASGASLSLSRDDGGLRPAVLHGLSEEPMLVHDEGSDGSVVAGIMSRQTALVFAFGDSGPLSTVLDSSGGKVAAIIAIPVKTPKRTLGLAAFYLPQETAPPPLDAMVHLNRLGDGFALILELASSCLLRERLDELERTAHYGRLSEQALLEMGPSMDRILATLGRLRSRRDLRGDLLSELVGIGSDLSRAKRYREAVFSFMAGQSPSIELIPLAPVFQSVRAWNGDSLERHNVRFEMPEPGPTDKVRADAFLLRSALSALIERAERDLAGKQGGLIRLSSRIEGDKAFIQVADNVGALRRSHLGASGETWASDSSNGSWPLSFVHNVVELFEGRCETAASERGNELTMVLSAK
jgi:signal recognition particle receptor subunit beta